MRATEGAKGNPAVWFLDFPARDPDSNYAEPSARQILYAKQAVRQLEQLKATLEKLTVPQQRAIIKSINTELVGGVFRHEPLTIRSGKSKVTKLADAHHKRRR
jgi:hypothetical protein